MASSGQLARAAARTLGIPEPSMMVYLRKLREGGLIEAGARGTNARNMTEHDLAHLVLGVMGSTLVSDTVTAASELRSLKCPGKPFVWSYPKNSKFVTNLRAFTRDESTSLLVVLAAALHLQGNSMLMPKSNGIAGTHLHPTVMRLWEEPVFRLRIFSPTRLVTLQYGNERCFETWVFGDLAPPTMPIDPFADVFSWYSALVEEHASQGLMTQVRELGSKALNHLVDVIFDRDDESSS